MTCAIASCFEADLLSLSSSSPAPALRSADFCGSLMRLITAMPSGLHQAREHRRELLGGCRFHRWRSVSALTLRRRGLGGVRPGLSRPSVLIVGVIALYGSMQFSNYLVWHFDPCPCLQRRIRSKQTERTKANVANADTPGLAFRCLVALRSRRAAGSRRSSPCGRCSGRGRRAPCGGRNHSTPPAEDGAQALSDAQRSLLRRQVRPRRL